MCGKWGEINLARARYKKIIIQNEKRSWQEPYTRLILRLTRAVTQPDKSHARRKQSEQEIKPDTSQKLALLYNDVVILLNLYSALLGSKFLYEKRLCSIQTQSHTDRQMDRIPKRHNKFVFKMYLWFFSRKDSRASTTSSSSLTKSFFNFPSKHLRSKVSSHFLISRILK